jgi:hypothetical protein
MPAAANIAVTRSEALAALQESGDTDFVRQAECLLELFGWIGNHEDKVAVLAARLSVAYSHGAKNALGALSEKVRGA